MIMHLTKARGAAHKSLRPKGQRPSDWSRDMTLCIAAFATSGWDEKRNPQTEIVLCSDLRIETPTAGSETTIKMKKIAKNWAVMIAGNVARAEELISIYCADLPEEPI